MRKILVITALLFALVACKKGDFENIIADLEPNAPLTEEHVQSVVKKIDSAKLTDEQAQEVRIAFEGYLLRYGESLALQLNLGDVQEDDIEELMDDARHCGIVLNEEFGDFYSAVSPHFIAVVFQKYLTPLEKDVLEMEELEVVAPSVLDGGLAISYQELQDRLYVSDRLYSECEDPILRDDIAQYRSNYLYYIMLGLDNTPAFDWEDGQMLEEAKQAILSYLTTYPNAYSKELLNEYLNLLKNSNYAYNEAVEKFIIDNTLNNI